MSTHSRAYRALTSLYPRSFRDEHGDDLVHFFEDLRSDRGTARAWARTAADLAITVPRYRLEHAMTDSRREAALITVTTALLAAAGITLLMVGLGPLLPLALLAAAVAGALTLRRTIANSSKAPQRRRYRLTSTLVLAVVFVAALASYLLDIRDDHITDSSLLAHGLIGMLTLAGATVTLIATLARPHHLENPVTTP